MRAGCSGHVSLQSFSYPGLKTKCQRGNWSTVQVDCGFLLMNVQCSSYMQNVQILSKRKMSAPPTNNYRIKNGGSYIECTPSPNSFNFTWTREVSLVHSAKPGERMVHLATYRNTEFFLVCLRVISQKYIPRE